MLKNRMRMRKKSNLKNGGFYLPYRARNILWLGELHPQNKGKSRQRIVMAEPSWIETLHSYQKEARYPHRLQASGSIL